MIIKEKNISIKPISFLKYIMWYILFSMIITGILIEMGQVKINPSDSILNYMLFNDVLYPLTLISFGLLINFATPENIKIKYILNKVLIKIDSHFKLWGLDFLGIVFASCYAVTKKLTNMEIILSEDKFKLILMLVFVAYLIKIFGWIMYIGLKNQVVELFDIIIFTLKSPGNIYQGIRKEINSTSLPKRDKQIVLKPIKILCVLTVILFAFAIVAIIMETIMQYI